MKKLLALLLAGAMALSMVACGGSEPATENAGEDKTTVCIVYSGNLGDKSYNDSCHAGVTQAAADFDIVLKELEGVTAEEWKANLLSACEEGYDLIICASSNCEEYMKEYAPMYPDIKFAIIDTTIPGDNIVSISFAQNQGSFLAGAAAAMFTEYTDIDGINEDAVIGWVGGMDIPVLQDFFIGYEQGAKYVNPDITVLQSFAGSWQDPLKGKELTLAQYAQGADVVMNCAAGTGPGILEAAKQEGKYAIGVDLNQDNDMPGSVLTSMVKRVDTACYSVIESVVNGTYEGGSVSYLTVADKGVSVTDFSVIKASLGDKFPEDMLTKLADIEAKIISGEIVVANYPGFGPQN